MAYRAERVWVRRRRSLWLAGGWWRGAPPTPGSERPPHLPRRGCPTSERCPPGNGHNGRHPPGVAPAPRLQPPANEKRAPPAHPHALRASRGSPPNARSALLFVKPHVGEAYVGGAEAMMWIEPRRGSLLLRWYLEPRRGTGWREDAKPPQWRYAPLWGLGVCKTALRFLLC